MSAQPINDPRLKVAAAAFSKIKSIYEQCGKQESVTLVQLKILLPGSSDAVLKELIRLSIKT